MFVVQQHAATRLHWDFRLEVDGVLVSWAIPKGPSLNPKDKRVAAHVEDHPYDYGSFEGVIPKGNYGAGHVIVWDTGTYSPDEKGLLSWGDKVEGSRRMREEIEAGKVSFTLRGRKLQGSWTLVRIKSDPKNWLLIKHRDEYASTRDVLEEDRSVLSGLTLQDLKEGRMPRLGDVAQPAPAVPHAAAVELPFPDPKSLRPMLATLIEAPFASPGWIFEPKLDGVRTLAFVRRSSDSAASPLAATRRGAGGEVVELRTRRGNNQTVQYPEVCRGLEEQPLREAVFDGEIVALNDHGQPEFQALQARINLSRPGEVERIAAETPAFLYVFDILYLDGYDLRQVPLIERKAILRRTLRPGPHVKLVDHDRDGVTLFEAAKSVGFEGVVGKRENSTYEAGLRTRSWLKVKAVNEQEFVVGGFTEGEGSRSKTFGGLLVGYYDDGDLRFAASVGSGFTDRMLESTSRTLKSLQVDESPFVNPPTVIGGRWAGGKSARCFWVKPELVAQVKFASWTREDNLRAPVFLGLRDDVDPRSIKREEPAAAAVDVIVEEEDPPKAATSGLHIIVDSVVDQLDSNQKAHVVLDVDGVPIKLTNLDKVFWPATKDHPERTKRELIRYYARVAPYILPHLRDRPLTLTRYPNGIHGKSFYQKHWPQPFPKEFHVERVSIYSSHNDADGDYIVVNNIQTLIWLAQLADLEIHAWMARTNPEPDARGLPTHFAGSEENMDRSVLNYPDYMVFDLDPYIYAGYEKKGEEPAFNKRGYEKTREVAFALKDLLQQLRLSSFVKTTGKTGLHIYVPVLRQYTYDEIRAASGVVGQFLMQQMPDDITMEWQTEKRRGKVFFDHNQNTRGKTLAAQYSLRPSTGANISVPVTWEELKTASPTDFDIDTGPDRFARLGDLWSNILDAKQDLRALITSS
jgi:bifunctional non-homologous end joining protein LigD